MIAVGTILFWSIVYGIFQAFTIIGNLKAKVDFPWKQFYPKEIRDAARERFAHDPARQKLFHLYRMQELIGDEFWQAVVVEVITTIVACFKVPQIWQVMNVHVPYAPVILTILAVNTIVLLVLGLMLIRARKALAEYVAKLPDSRIGTEED